MGDTYRGTATSLTEQRTNRMILILSIGIVFTLAVGGFVVVNSYGDQNQRPIDDPQKMVLDSFAPAETAQLQALREPDFVMESESSCLGPFCTEQGSIDFYADNIDGCLPLCINNSTLAGYYVDVVVYGGYTPLEGTIEVYQKFAHMGTIYVQWTAINGQGGCCATFYEARFFVRTDFCLESSQYPEVAPWAIDHTPGDTIPGKEVYFHVDTLWTGCGCKDQDFTIIHSQSYQALSRWIIPALKTHIPYIYLKHKQSIWCYNQTALVYGSFLNRNKCTAEVW
jgi:hypothetical protein